MTPSLPVGTADVRLAALVASRAALSRSRSVAERTPRLPNAGMVLLPLVTASSVFVLAGASGRTLLVAFGVGFASAALGRFFGVVIRESLRERIARRIKRVNAAIETTVLQARPMNVADPAPVEISPQAAVHAVVSLSQISIWKARGQLEGLAMFIPSPIARSLALCSEDADDVASWGFTPESFREALVRAQSPQGMVVFDAVETAWPILVVRDAGMADYLDRKAAQLGEVLRVLDVLEGCPGAFEVFAALANDAAPATLDKMNDYIGAALTISAVDPAPSVSLSPSQS